MKQILTLTVFLCLPFLVASQIQNTVFEGKMLVEDINTIATFQSRVKNAYIRIANNDDPNSGTNIGYFNDSINEDKYFFIDLPDGNFGEFVIRDNGNVGIGNLDPTRKLHVYDDNSGSWFESLTGDGLRAKSRDSRAIFAQSSSIDYPCIEAASIADIGILSDNRGENIGIMGRSYQNSISYAIYNVGVGVYGTSEDGHGIAGFSRNNHAIIGNTVAANSSDFWAVHGTYGGPSSRRWKNNVENIPDALDKLSKIRGVYFDWDEVHGGQHAVGFIAEEVGKVLPEVVFYEENGFDASGMDYSKMTPLLVEAANEMRAEYQGKFEEEEDKNRAQDKEIQTLKAELKLIRELLHDKSLSLSGQ